MGTVPCKWATEGAREMVPRAGRAGAESAHPEGRPWKAFRENPNHHSAASNSSSCPALKGGCDQSRWETSPSVVSSSFHPVLFEPPNPKAVDQSLPGLRNTVSDSQSPPPPTSTHLSLIWAKRPWRLLPRYLTEPFPLHSVTWAAPGWISRRLSQ